MSDYFDPASLLIGALVGACVALMLLLRRTRRCTCLPPDFRESELETKL